MFHPSFNEQIYISPSEPILSSLKIHNNLVSKPNTMSDEISSRFQGEHTITKTIMDFKIALIEQRLIKRIVQLIQEQFSRLELTPQNQQLTNLCQIAPRSTIPATRGNTLPTYNGTNNPLLGAHRCEYFLEKNCIQREQKRLLWLDVTYSDKHNYDIINLNK